MPTNPRTPNTNTSACAKARESNAAPSTPTSTVESGALLGTRGELKISHNGEIYSLRRTRLGKLILTK
jgi:hemin uptake protein HemP